MKKLNTLLLAAALAVSTIVSVSALELAAPEPADEYTAANESAVLAEDYGTLINSQDYEAANALNSVFVSGGSGVYAFGSGASATLETPSGVTGASQMMRIDAAGATGPAAGYTNFSLTDAGTYTFVFDYYVPSDFTYGWFRIVHNMSGVDDLTISATKGSLQKNYVAQLEVPAGKTFSSFKFQVYYYGTAMNNSVYIDNLRLYYKAPAPTAITATVYTSAAGTASFATYADLAAGDTVTLPTSRAFAANTPSGSYLNGFIAGKTTLAPGAVYTVTADDLASGALAIVPTFGETGKPGALVYENTYDSATDYNSKPIQVVSMGIGTSNTSGNIWGMGYNSTFSLETPAGMSSPLLKVSGTGGYVPAGYVNGTINVPGTYTLVVDYYIPTEGGNIVLDVGFGSLKSGTNGVQFKEFYGTQGKLTTYTLPFELAAGSSIGGAYISRAYTAGSFYIDTMRMYFTPARPAVSIHVLDAEGGVSVDTNVASGASVTLPTAMPKTGAILTGFTCGGTSFAPGASYTVTAADAMKGYLDFTPAYRTVTPAHPADGALILQENFENIADDTVIFNSADQGGIFTAYKNGYIATPNISENTAFAGKTFCFIRGSALNTSYVTTASGVKGVAVAQPVNGSSKFPVFGLAGGNSNSNESLALTEDGFYTVYADFGIRAEDIDNYKRVFIQVTYTDGTNEAFNVYPASLSAASLNTVKAEIPVRNGRGIKLIVFAAETATANDNVVFMVDNIELYYAKGTATISDGVGSFDILYKPGTPFALPTYDDLGYEPVFVCGGKTYYAGDKITVTDASASIEVSALDVLTVNKAQLRTQNSTKAGGLRFASFIADEVKEDASSYGFIIALADSFTDGDYEALAFPASFAVGSTGGSGTLASGKAFVYGVCYDESEGLDLVYATDDGVFGGDIGYEDRYTEGGTYFTGVLTGMTGYAQYSADIAARPFAVLDGVTVYGRPIVRNLYDMAVSYQASVGEGTDSYVDAIVASKN